MVCINKKEYPDNGIFKNQFIDEYCNLNIYPYVNELETEAGIISDFAEAYQMENTPAKVIIYSERCTQFLKDTILNDVKVDTGITIGYTDSFTNIFTDVLIGPDHPDFDKLYYKKIQIHGLSKVMYLTESSLKIFNKYFWYYYDQGIWKYSNLICYTMIIKNGGPLLEKVLTENLNIIDRWCILDTGSTDGSQEIIKRVLKNKKGKLFEEPFVDFKVSRNRCLELAKHTCKFILMLDDTYYIKGDLRSFLTEVRGDQFSDSFSLLIQSDDTEYYSNRIIKSKTNLRYIHTIHEVITDKNNINVTVPKNKAVVFDHRADYMEQRTTDRKQFDLQLLFKEVENDPDDPRALYYIAQTYGCIGDEKGKAEFFEKRINHPITGYYQEKIDACFELARCYNFKISPITKKPHTEPLTEEEWKICEKLYLKAYSLDTHRPDSLYFIGIHYYLQGLNGIAYKYFKMAFEIGYPIGSQYSLKPTLSFHFLPKFLAEVSYYFKDYSSGFNAAHLFLTNQVNNPSSDSWNTMSNWYRVYSNLLQMPVVSKNPNILNRKIFCIVTDGGWEPWTGKDILTKGLGGSETWIVEMAKYISQNDDYYVVVFCKTDKPEFFEKVGYNPIESFHEFIANTVVEYCIISRYPEYIHVAIAGHAKNIGIIFHDNLSPEIIIPVHPKLKWIWGLTKWHSDSIKKVFPQFEKITNFINYGVNYQINSINGVKIKNSFIYSSFPNRGLIILLRMWPKIIKQFPDATLNIFCNLEQDWVNQVSPDMMKEVKVNINQTGIINHGWVSKKELMKFWNQSEYFLYPCIFEETFCLTALEAAISKTCVVTNGLAALGETVGDRGAITYGNPFDIDWQDNCLNKLFYVMCSNDKRNELIECNYQWAKKLTWENQAKELMNVINHGT